MEGVNVDDEDIGFYTCTPPKTVSTVEGGAGGGGAAGGGGRILSGAEALTEFFRTPEKQNILDPETLELEARAWLGENPNVNEADFMAEINRYIHQLINSEHAFDENPRPWRDV